MDPLPRSNQGSGVFTNHGSPLELLSAKFTTTSINDVDLQVQKRNKINLATAVWCGYLAYAVCQEAISSFQSLGISVSRF